MADITAFPIPTRVLDPGELNGREVELGTNSTHIQWRYAGDTTWTDLIALSLLQGPAGDGTGTTAGTDGREVELAVAGGFIQWRYVGDTTWVNLLETSTLVGPQGPVGATGDAGPIGPAGPVGPAGTNGIDGAQGPVGPQGPIGPAGQDGTSINLLGSLNTSADLPVSGTAIGDAYLITGNIWIWDGAAWTDGGNIQGPQGEPGTPGVDGTNGIDGIDGKQIELSTTSTNVVWRYVGDVIWNAVVPLADLIGPEGPQGIQGIQGTAGLDGTNGTNGVDGIDGKDVELQVSATHIQWRKTGDLTWIDLVALTTLQGPQGIQGIQGPAGLDGTNGTDGVDGVDGTSLTNAGAWVSNTLYSPGSYTTAESSNDPTQSSLFFLIDTVAYTSVLAPKDDLTHWVELSPPQGPAGTDGREVEFQVNATHLQWRYVGELTWLDLVALTALTGPQGPAGIDGTDGVNGTDGREAEFQANATHIQYRLVGDVTWLDLVPLTEVAVTDTGGGTSVTLATLEQTKAAVLNDVATTPAGVREFIEQFGWTASYLTEETDLNTARSNAVFGYGPTTLNIPGTVTYGRGITLTSSQGYATQFAIENNTGIVFTRFEEGVGNWTVWGSVGSGDSYTGPVINTPTAGEADYVLHAGTTEGTTYWAAPAGGNSGTVVPLSLESQSGYMLYAGATAGSAYWGEAPSGITLPSLSTNAGKLLSVNATEDATEWVDPPTGGSTGGGPTVLTDILAADIGTGETTLPVILSVDVLPNKVYEFRAVILSRATAPANGCALHIGGTFGYQSLSVKATMLDSAGVLAVKHVKLRETNMIFDSSFIGGDDNLLEITGTVFVTGAGTLTINYGASILYTYTAAQKGSFMMLTEVGDLV